MTIQEIIRIRKELFNIKKEGFPIPSPEKNEEQDKYISRCISSIVDEYGQEKASGICYGQWENRVS
jgi:hypothetical protein